MLAILTAIGGPVFAKELVEMARRKRHFFSRVLCGGAILFILFLVYEANQFRLQRSRGAQYVNALVDLGEEMFVGVCTVQYMAVFLFAPLLLCGAIASEREERTLDLLLTTELRPRHIILGKLLSRTAVMVLLIATALPVVSLIMLFGGVDPRAIWRTAAATLLAILYAGSHAIYFSTVTGSTVGALVRTYWWLGFWLLGVPALVMIPVAASTPGPTAPVALLALSFLYLTNPVGPFFVALTPTAYKSLGAQWGSWIYAAGYIFPTLVSATLIWRSTRRLPLPPTVFALLWHRIRERQWVKRRRERRQQRRSKRAERRRLRAERFWFLPVTNPLWLRSRLVRVYDRERYIGRIQWAAWILVAVFLALVLVTERRTLKFDDASIGFLIPVWTGVVALTLIFAATSLIGDRRRGFLELVLATPLTAAEIVRGSFLAVYQHQRRLLWLPVVLSILFGFLGSSMWVGLLLSFTTAILFTALLAVYGLACSAAARTTASALVAAVTLPLVTLLGVALVGGLFNEAHGVVLWILTVPVFVVSAWWVRRRPALPAVASFLTSGHVLLALIFSAWVFALFPESPNYARALPGEVIHPLVMVTSVLAKHPGRWFYGGDLLWPWYYVSYLPTLIVSIAWFGWWLERNFDRLAGRALQGRQALRAAADNRVGSEVPRQASA